MVSQKAHESGGTAIGTDYRDVKADQKVSSPRSDAVASVATERTPVRGNTPKQNAKQRFRQQSQRDQPPPEETVAKAVNFKTLSSQDTGNSKLDLCPICSLPLLHQDLAAARSGSRQIVICQSSSSTNTTRTFQSTTLGSLEEFSLNDFDFTTSTFRPTHEFAGQAASGAASMAGAACGFMVPMQQMLEDFVGTYCDTVCEAQSKQPQSAQQSFNGAAKKVPPYCANCKAYIVQEEADGSLKQEEMLNNLASWLAASSSSEDGGDHHAPKVAFRPSQGSITVILEDEVMDGNQKATSLAPGVSFNLATAFDAVSMPPPKSPHRHYKSSKPYPESVATSMEPSIQQWNSLLSSSPRSSRGGDRYSLEQPPSDSVASSTMDHVSAVGILGARSRSPRRRSYLQLLEEEDEQQKPQTNRSIPVDPSPRVPTSPPKSVGRYPSDEQVIEKVDPPGSSHEEAPEDEVMGSKSRTSNKGELEYTELKPLSPSKEHRLTYTVEDDDNRSLGTCNTLVEEKLIIADYEKKREIATKAIGRKLMEGFILTQTQCIHCQMPVMERNGLSECVVCPLVSKKAKKRAAFKRRGMAQPSMDTFDSESPPKRTQETLSKNGEITLENLRDFSDFLVNQQNEHEDEARGPFDTLEDDYEDINGWGYEKADGAEQNEHQGFYDEELFSPEDSEDAPLSPDSKDTHTGAEDPDGFNPNHQGQGMDAASQEVYHRLLSGWLLADSNCEECFAPLMKSADGEVQCVFCDQGNQSEQSSITNSHRFYDPIVDGEDEVPVNFDEKRGTLQKTKIESPVIQPTGVGMKFLAIPDDIDLDDHEAVLAFLAKLKAKETQKGLGQASERWAEANGPGKHQLSNRPGIFSSRIPNATRSPSSRDAPEIVDESKPDPTGATIGDISSSNSSSTLHTPLQLLPSSSETSKGRRNDDTRALKVNPLHTHAQDRPDRGGQPARAWAERNHNGSEQSTTNYFSFELHNETSKENRSPQHSESGVVFEVMPDAFDDELVNFNQHAGLSFQTVPNKSYSSTGQSNKSSYREETLQAFKMELQEAPDYPQEAHDYVIRHSIGKYDVRNCHLCKNPTRKDPTSTDLVCGNPHCRVFMIPIDSVQIFTTTMNENSEPTEKDAYSIGLITSTTKATTVDSYLSDKSTWQVQPAYSGDRWQGYSSLSPAVSVEASLGSERFHELARNRNQLDSRQSDEEPGESFDYGSRISSNADSINSDALNVLFSRIQSVRRPTIVSSDANGEQNSLGESDISKLIDRLASAAVEIQDLEQSVIDEEESSPRRSYRVGKPPTSPLPRSLQRGFEGDGVHWF